MIKVIELQCDNPLDETIKIAAKLNKNNYKVFELLSLINTMKYSRLENTSSKVKFAVSNTDIIWGNELIRELSMLQKENKKIYEVFDGVYELEYDEFNKSKLYKLVEEY